MKLGRKGFAGVAISCALTCAAAGAQASASRGERDGGAGDQQRGGRSQPALGSRSVSLLTQGRWQFKDLNRDGTLEVYEDWRRTPQERAADLASRMTLDELAGTMVHGTLPAPGNPVGFGTSYDLEGAAKLIQRGITTMLSRNAADAAGLAKGSNDLQAVAEQGRLGIPLTISSDPRNQLGATTGASTAAGSFSKWPDPPGLAATRDARLVRRFGDVARQEYLAVGLREALSPQADLATEPRWYRISGTFGEDADVARALVAAYVQGFQGGRGGLGPESVSSVVKHWAGYGAQEQGFDSHNPYGKTASFSGRRSFGEALVPFTGAFASGVAGVMPTYSIIKGVTVDGRPLEPVGAAFNKQLLTDLLRDQFGFDGVILTDWAVTNDCQTVCANGFPAGQTPVIDDRFGTPWGVEDLPKVDRFVKAVDAGVDQFGGTDESQYLVQAVAAGKLTRQRLVESAQRILVQKFEQGLFENPYVDEAAAQTTVGNADFNAQALDAQRRSLVLLKNDRRVLPLKGARKVYLRGVDPAVAATYGLQPVATPEAADVAIVRASTPYEVLHPTYAFGVRAREGNLAFGPGNADYEAIKDISSKVPTIVTVYMDRPAILTEINDKAQAIVANFGVTDTALLDVLTGKAEPQGRLPFELPSSMAEVTAQLPDRPHDTAHPLYPYDYGLTYRRHGDR
jgi:beta-glucosidase